MSCNLFRGVGVECGMVGGKHLFFLLSPISHPTFLLLLRVFVRVLLIHPCFTSLWWWGMVDLIFLNAFYSVGRGRRPGMLASIAETIGENRKEEKWRNVHPPSQRYFEFSPVCFFASRWEERNSHQISFFFVRVHSVWYIFPRHGWGGEQQYPIWYIYIMHLPTLLLAYYYYSSTEHVDRGCNYGNT